MPTVLAIGESMIELQQTGAHALLWTFAGDALNCAAAVAAAHPSAEVEHLTGLGDDEHSAGLRDFCTALDVDASRSPVLPGKSLGLYWITTEDGDRRFTYWRNDSAARQLFRSNEMVLFGPTPDLVIISGITLAVAGPAAPQLLDQIEQASTAGAKIAYDTNHRPLLCPDIEAARAHAERALSLADIVHASADDLDELWGGDTTLDSWPQTFGITELIVTDGDRPVRVLSNGSEARAQPDPVPVVDTAGAGDAFFGTYVGHRLAELPTMEALARALEVSSEVVQSPGALTYLIDPA